MELFLNIIFLKIKEKKRGEKSTKRKTILTMVLHQKWRFFTFNKFYLRVFKLIGIKKFRGIAI